MFSQRNSVDLPVYVAALNLSIEMAMRLSLKPLSRYRDLLLEAADIFCRRIALVIKISSAAHLGFELNKKIIFDYLY